MSQATPFGVIREVKDSQLSDAGIAVLFEFLVQFSHGVSLSIWLRQLPFRDQLRLAPALLSSVLPGIGSCLAPGDGCEEPEEFSGNPEKDEFPQNACQDPYMQGDHRVGVIEAGVVVDVEEGVESGICQLPQVGSSDPISVSLTKLSTLLQVLSCAESSVVIKRLCTHIEKCHVKGLKPPSKHTSLVSLADNVTSMFRFFDAENYSPNAFLEKLCIF